MPYAPAEFLHVRQNRLRDALKHAELDGLIVTHLPNIFYLTNFTGSSAILLITADRLRFITDFRYLTAIDEAKHAGRGPADLEVVRVEGSYDQALADLLAEHAQLRLGFESDHLPVSRFQWLTDSLRAQVGRDWSHALKGVEGFVERARLRKDAHEIAILRAAAARLSEVTPDILAEARRGRSEREVAGAIDWRMRQAGFDKPAFDTIVGSGPNGALPHARPGSRVLADGDLVVLDFGAVYDGYCVDSTRMVSLGRPDREAARVFDAVAEAQAAAIAAVRPGVSRFAIDAAARDTLARHGLAEQFGHGTGHGLGIEVHEAPRITRRPKAAPAAGLPGEPEPVEPDMVFTIEPGAYLPGRLGVRIEDDVLVTSSGVDVLTSAARELAVR
ncbi:MAG TPA: Xaa-Pro peptidase family protein [Vicinamibacterales bacterium]|jgi:Xaa-Pro aminopeptidase